MQLKQTYTIIYETTLFIILILINYTPMYITLFVLATNVSTSDIRQYLTNEHHALMYVRIYVYNLVPCRTCRLPLAT